MLRLYLRLYLILALGLAGSIWLVNFGLDAYMPESNETYNREALRGPAIEGVRPSAVLEGKSTRFDLYVIRALRPAGAADAP